MAYAGQYRTTADLFSEVLADLGVLSSGQPLDPEDLNYVTSMYDSILRKLDALEICHLSSYDDKAIPGEWFKDLISIIAGEVCSKFGYTGQEAYDKMNAGLGGAPSAVGEIPAGGGAAAKSLKQMNRLKPTLEPLRVDYF